MMITFASGIQEKKDGPMLTRTRSKNIFISEDGQYMALAKMGGLLEGNGVAYPFKTKTIDEMHKAIKHVRKTGSWPDGTKIQ